jgi:predicted acetyltransferase
MSLPDESMFLNFWQKEKKWSYFLTFNNNPVGFVLLQIIRESKTNAMEVGAIFVKKENRSINSLKLYRKSLECANDNNLALVSEIAKDNSHSINVFNTLKKRYSRSSNLRFMRKDIDANRVLVSCEIE